jgi:acyl-CoA synthetase (AMP-forming)/AMP-acid ligase II
LRAAIVDQDLKLVTRGTKGELCISGPQVSLGYVADPEENSRRFVHMPWDKDDRAIWYRTGDSAYMTAAGTLIFCGRQDDQVKIRGFRIELGEIESVMRECAQTTCVAAVAYELQGLASLGCVIVGSVRSRDAIVSLARQQLPEYMLPSRILFLQQLPLSPNGKVDKHKLRMLFEVEESVDHGHGAL